MNNNGNIYLSGAMQFAADGNLGAGWRIDCASKLQESGYSPIDITMMDKLYNEKVSESILCHLKGLTTADDYKQRKSDIRRHFVEADLNIIRFLTDAMIVRFDEGVRRGAGTISECQYAYNLKVPIFLVNEFDTVQDIPGWLYALTTRVFHSWEHLYSYLGSLPPGILKKDQYGNHRSGSQYLCSLCGEVEEKHGDYFVSHISPFYCKQCVGHVRATHENHSDRYEFIAEQLNIPVNYRLL